MGDFLSAAKNGDERAFERLLAPFQRELRSHCYRMTGSLLDAEDLLQESRLRAWKGLPSFEGRCSLRTWLYRVSTNACFDLLERRDRARTTPPALGPANRPDAVMMPDLDPLWLLEPFPDPRLEAGTPEARYVGRQNVALAFLAALQLLPPKQRAVVLLCDVIGLAATECAALLEQSVAAVNSALQRGRETLDQRAELFREAPGLPDAATQLLLERYLRAWQEADVDALMQLLKEDAQLTMPPFAAWFSGAEAIARSLRANVLPPGSPGHFRLLPIRSNGVAGFAAYGLDNAGFKPTGLHSLDVRDGKIAAITAFLQPALFSLFDLPSTL